MAYDMKQERELFRRLETEEMMTTAQQEKYWVHHGQNGVLAVAEDRKNPIHDTFRFPVRWLAREEP